MTAAAGLCSGLPERPHILRSISDKPFDQMIRCPGLSLLNAADQIVAHAPVISTSIYRKLRRVRWRACGPTTRRWVAADPKADATCSVRLACNGRCAVADVILLVAPRWGRRCSARFVGVRARLRSMGLRSGRPRCCGRWFGMLALVVSFLGHASRSG